MRELLYLGGGVAAGWVIGKLLFGDEPIRSNASKKRSKKRPTGERAIAQTKLGPDDPVKQLKAAIPEYVQDTTLWSTLEPDRAVVMQKYVHEGEEHAEPIGFVEKQKNNRSNAIVLIGEHTVPVLKNTSREKAIGAVYAADRLFTYLQARRGYVDSAGDIAEALNVPLSLVIKIGETLAEDGRIFGITAKVLIDPVVPQEKLLIPGLSTVREAPDDDEPADKTFEEALRERERREKEIARKRSRQKRKRKIQHKRRKIVAGKAEASKLRKSPLLTPEERKALPKAKIVERYAFGLFGLHGMKGMHKVDPEQQKFDRELAREELLGRKAEREAKKTPRKQEEITEWGESVLDKDIPIKESYEKTIRKLLMDPEEEPSDAFFEARRLEGLDWLSMQKDPKYRARKVEAAQKRVEQLRKALAEAKRRREAAEAAGDGNRMIEATAQQMKIQSELGAALERLARVQPPKDDK